MAMPQMPKWYDDDGQIVSCTEKVKVMTENLNELYQIAQDAFEDALLMGCSEKQLREYFRDLMAGLENPYQKNGDVFNPKKKRPFKSFPGGLFLSGISPTLLLTFHHAHGYRYGFFLQGNGQACERGFFIGCLHIAAGLQHGLNHFIK